MISKKATSILLFILVSKFVSGQYNNDGYFEVFYETNIFKDKNVLFQNYWASNYFITDSIAKAEKIRSLNVIETCIKRKYKHHSEYNYDKAGRNTYSSSFYNFEKSKSDRGYIFSVNYKYDTGRKEYTQYYIDNAKLMSFYQSEKISDSLHKEISRNGNFGINRTWLYHKNSQNITYLLEEFKGPKEKLFSRTYYEYYPNNSLKSKKIFDTKGKLRHSWIYMDCGSTPTNKKHDDIDTINICRSSSVDKDGNLHEYITYTSLEGIVYKHEKIYNKSGNLSKHFSINTKTGFYYNLGEAHTIGDTTVYTYTRYNEKNGKVKSVNTYSYVADKIVIEDVKWYKRGKEKNHEETKFIYDNTGKPLKKYYTDYTYKVTSESIYSYQYY